MFARRTAAAASGSGEAKVLNLKSLLGLGLSVPPASPPLSPTRTPGGSSPRRTPLPSPDKPLPPVVPAAVWGGLPEEWDSYNDAYASGKLDFDAPPRPPSKLSDSTNNRTESGSYFAPRPKNEARRQRAVDTLSMGLPKPQSKRRRAAPPTSSVAIDSPPTTPGAIASASTSSPSAPLASTSPKAKARRPKELATYGTLQSLAVSASQHFGTGVSSVSLMDRDQQVFLAEVGLDTDSVAREATVCSHTMLKASTGQKDPLIVLNIAKDWRFEQNNFGKYSKGFYAALPIMIPAAFGDADQSATPGGIFCILDDKPRSEFTSADRAKLVQYADEAALEIARFQEEEREKHKAKLVVKREEWRRRSKVVKKVARQTPLESVVEVETPPSSPITEEEPSFAVVLQSGKRPSLARTLTSESSTSNIITTEVTPTFSKRRLVGQVGLHASASPRMPSDVKSMLDLSTALIAESLDLEFTYLISFDTEIVGPLESKHIKLLSAHNVPIPAPLFDVQMHLETLVSSSSALLYTNANHTGQDGEYSTGLLVKVMVADGKGYVLGGFSESPSKVLARQDFHFFRSFAHDISRILQQQDLKA